MALSRGDDVVATRHLGMLGQVPRGSSGTVTEAGFFGDYTVTFEDGSTMRGLRADDLREVPAGPWWMRPAPSSDVGQQAGTHQTDGFALRVAIAAVLLTLTVSALSFYL